ARDIKPVKPYVASDATSGHIVYQNSTTCSYAASAGDVYPSGATYGSHTNTFRRSPFSYRGVDGVVQKDFSSISDGLSNTIVFGERCVATSETTHTSSGAGSDVGATGVLRGTVVLKPASGGTYNSVTWYRPSYCFSAKAYQNDYTALPCDGFSGYLGRAAWMGSPGMVMFSTILPPNSPSCASGTGHWYNTAGIISASSFHSGGANTVFADGSVHFISETIDSQSSSTALNTQTNNLDSASPFGVWGALGSCNGGDLGSL
ncbi:MAG: DUF1559 domain-containing protein, partial [Planctomycetaceae bacterium]|nr:DUF1559 domain-containing protein [Planctomycetaceae bacterium]